MPKNVARAVAFGRWSPIIRCISSLETNACTAPDSPKPSTSAHSVSQNMKNASRRLCQMSVISGTHETGDGGRRLGHLGVCLGAAARHRLPHAMCKVVVEQFQGDGLEGLGGGRD